MYVLQHSDGSFADRDGHQRPFERAAVMPTLSAADDWRQTLGEPWSVRKVAFTDPVAPLKEHYLIATGGVTFGSLEQAVEAASRRAVEDPGKTVLVYRVVTAISVPLQIERVDA